MEGLLDSVRETRSNLVDKRDFLEDQKEEYVKIRAHLVQLPDYSKPNVTSKDDEVKGLVLGDVIISRVFEDDTVISYRIFVNIGCEYFVERDKVFAVGFIEDKIDLIQEAIAKFNEKILEANNTEKNLKETIEYEEALRKGQSKVEEVHDEEEFDDEDLPPMEIREELDEDGNVINSSVTKAATKQEALDIQDKMFNQKSEENPEQVQQDDKTTKSDLEKNIKGKLLSKTNKSKDSGPLLDKVDKITQIESVDKSDDKNVQPRSLDTDNIYTFADLVEQIDHEDGDFDPVMEIDDESFNKWEINEQEYDDEDSDDELFDDDRYDGFGVAASVVPGRAQSSFMEQIQKLRNQQKNKVPADEIEKKRLETPSKSVSRVLEVHEPEHDVMNNEQLNVTKDSKKNIKKAESTTSILKKSNKSKKKKKSVGFAQSLQVHEVESFKEENKKQMHKFNPANMFDMDSYEPESENPDDPSSTADFDSDLFAQLIGAKEADEIHDKYIEDYENQQRKEQETKKKNRVSRFKASIKEKGNSESAVKSSAISDAKDLSTKDVLTNETTDEFKESIAKNGNVKRAVEDEVVERAVQDEVVERAVEDEVIERAVEDEVIERAVEDEVIERAVEDEVVERAVEDEVVERAVEDEVVERAVEEEIVERVVNNDITDRDVGEKIKESRFSRRSKFKKDKNSKFSNKPKPKEKGTPSTNKRDEPVEKFEELERAEIEELGKDNIIMEKEIRGDEEMKQSSVDKKDLKKSTDLPVIPKELKEYLEKGEAKEKFNKARVDFQSLGDNLDDMAVAYSMGLYDDDVEDPGTIIEHIKDFENYNKEVKELEGTIKEFRLNNPMQSLEDEEEEDGPMMTDIQEKDIPESYNEEDEEEDYSLNPDSLSHSIALEYRNKKEQMINKLMADAPPDIINENEDDQRQIEPIDEHGNPIKQSRFKSQRAKLGKMIL